MSICDTCTNGNACALSSDWRVRCKYYNDGTVSDCDLCDLKAKCNNYSTSAKTCAGYAEGEPEYIGEQLREWRKTHGMTQKALAESLGWHVSSIKHIENGDREVSKQRKDIIKAMISAGEE